MQPKGYIVERNIHSHINAQTHARFGLPLVFFFHIINIRDFWFYYYYFVIKICKYFITPDLQLGIVLHTWKNVKHYTHNTTQHNKR